MSHTPHELSEQLPEFAAAIAMRKLSDAHFAKLADKHHEMNREIHRGETDVQPMDDMHLVELRKKRLALLDEIRGILTA
ncbi:MAG: hypothetical protein ACJAVR_003942 [Paracoccaceae bacterium]|jgi:uncharacterized protein YdcH (DUF465 family)